MDSRNRRDGAAIEELGWYNPIDIEHSFSLNEERIIHWIQDGEHKQLMKPINY